MEAADTLTLRDVTPPVAAPGFRPVQSPTEMLDRAEIANGTPLVKYSRTEAALADLKARHAGATFDLTTTAGDKAARAARLELVTLRTTLEKRRKEFKAPALAFGKLIDTEAERITAEIVALETPIDQQIKADEQRRERERAEAARIEAERIAKHQAGLSMIRAYLTRCAGLSADRIQKGIDLLKEATFGSEWEEFAVSAANAQCETLEAMRLLHAETLAREQAAAAAEAQRVENARVAAELAEQRRQLEAQQAEVKRQADELAAQRAESERLEREAEARRAAHEREAKELADTRARVSEPPATMPLPASTPAVAYGASLGTPTVTGSATATVRDPTPEERAAFDARQAVAPTLVMSDNTTQPEKNDAVAGPVQRAVRPLVERLRLRTLVQHGGPRGMDYGWNLQEHDSELHRDAAECLLELLRWKSTHAPRLEALEGLLRTAQQEAHAERERCASLCEKLAEETRAEMLKQPANSPARDRYFARGEALRSAAVEMRLGPNDGTKGPAARPVPLE